MRIIFFGTSDLAAYVLQRLYANKHKVLGVVTAPDKRKGRGQKIATSFVKIFAQKNNLSLWQPRSLENERFLQSLKEQSADLFVVCAYGKILTKEVLQIPNTYAINLHTSLLPKYRGAAPINWAIIKGERETGVSVFKMNEYMDQGEIILQKKIDILASDTAVSLTDRLSELSACALVEAIDLIEGNRATFSRQDETQVCFAPKLKKKDGLINWHSPALEIHNRIRGLQPWPGAFTYLGNKLLKIWQSKVVRTKAERSPAEVVKVDKKGILVQTANGQLLLVEVQLEGKRRMSVTEFVLGHKLAAGEKLGRRKDG